MNDATRALTAAGLRLPLAGFVVDLGGEQLRDAQGRAVELRPQAWAVLRHLALNAGRLVSKDEFLDAICPGLVVTDGSLTQAVSEVREALGEAGHRVIKTVHERGYMLVADAALPGLGELAEAPPRSKLPAEIDPLIGRGDDLATLHAWLDEHRLVTVFGAGGLGKTRLAQAVAARRINRHVHGVCLARALTQRQPRGNRVGRHDLFGRLPRGAVACRCSASRRSRCSLPSAR